MKQLVMHGLVVVLVASTASAQPKVSMPKWQGGVVIDPEVRSALRAPTISGRTAADDLSSVLLYGMVAAPFVAGTARTFALHGSLLDAAALALVSSEAFGVAFAATFLVKGVVGRERPFATAEGLSTYCTSHTSDPTCGSDRNASFFSGHSAIAFTSAGLLCTQQLVFGTRGMDALGCAGGMIAATATAMLRIVADMHYATDTLVGAAVGLGAGMLLPYVLHFAPWAPFPLVRKLRDPARSGSHAPLVDVHVTPWGGPGGGGLSIGGNFW